LKNSLKEERARLRITQADLADMVNVSRQTINSIEVNRYVPSTTLALKIAKVMYCRIDDLFELEKSDWD